MFRYNNLSLDFAIILVHVAFGLSVVNEVKLMILRRGGIR